MMPQTKKSSIHYRSIFTRLFFGILAMVVGMMVTAGFFIGNQSDAMLHEKSRQQLSQAAHSTLAEASNRVHSIVVTLQSFASTYKNSKVSNSQVFGIFTDLAAQHPTISELQLATADGKYVTFPSSPIDAYDPRESEWYSQALALSQQPAYVSDVFQFSETEFPKIAVSVPLFTEDGDTAGVVVAFVSVPKLSEFIGTIKIGQTGYAMIVDQKGTLVAHPDKNYALQRPSLDQLPVVQEVMAEKSGIDLLTLDQADYLAAYQYEPWLRWGIIVTQGVSEVEREVELLQLTILTVSLIGLAALAVLLFGFVRKIVNPIKEVQQKMTAFSNGNLSLSMQVQTNDELRQLADSFNRMTGQIGSIISKIQHVISDVKQVAKHVEAGSRRSHDVQSEVVHVTEQLSHEMDEQQTQITEIHTHVNGITQEMNRITSLVQTAVGQNLESRQQTSSASDSIQQLQDEMVKISEDMRTSLLAVSAMKESMLDISDISGMILDISKRTKLLSLNARIEASRAGQAGLGFGVVADEIGLLSAQTETATSRIQQVIAEGEKRMEHVSHCMQTTDTATLEAIQTLQQATETFTNTVQISDTLTGQFQAIDQLSTHIHQHSQLILERVDALSASALEVIGGMQQAVASNQESLMYSQQFLHDSGKLTFIVEDLEQEIRFFQTTKTPSA